MTISNEDQIKPLTWKDFHEIDFVFNSPFRLTLADGNTFFADEVVRVVPKRRLVAFGTWQGKPVVAKLFFDSARAKRHIDKDVAGIKTLKDNRIPTPELYYQGISADRRIYVLLFERIFDAESLGDIWHNRDAISDLLPLLQSVMIELATQHVLGVMQQDLHLNNFLLTEKLIYTLDGGDIELFPPLLPKKASMDALALFLAQFGVGVSDYQEKMFRFYAKARGWAIKKEDLAELFLAIKKWNGVRWKRYEKKIIRDCTDYARTTSFGKVGMYDRDYALPEFMDVLKHPESAFHHPSAVMLKAGRSATVIKVTLDNRDLVIKRYNLKNNLHRLRRLLRETRALISWRLAHKLTLFGLRTAKPIAFIEKKYFCFRGKSYYITDYVSGEHIGDYFEKYIDHEEKTNQMINRVVRLLKSLAKLEITHGDLKMTNILIDAMGRPVLIDLDGAAEHFSLSGLRHAWKKEIIRFLKNFRQLPLLQERIRKEIEV